MERKNHFYQNIKLLIETNTIFSILFLKDKNILVS